MMAVAAYIESEPRVSTAKEDAEIAPLAIVVPEVGQGSLGCIDAVNGFILVDVGRDVLDDLFDVGGGLVKVALNVHSEARGFGDGETEVEGDASGDAAETDEEAPHVVDGLEVCDVRFGENGILVAGGDDEGDQSSSYENIRNKKKKGKR
jgi:hypothetical protein